MSHNTENPISHPKNGHSQTPQSQELENKIQEGWITIKPTQARKNRMNRIAERNEASYAKRKIITEARKSKIEKTTIELLTDEQVKARKNAEKNAERLANVSAESWNEVQTEDTYTDTDETDKEETGNKETKWENIKPARITQTVVYYTQTDSESEEESNNATKEKTWVLINNSKN